MRGLARGAAPASRHPAETHEWPPHHGNDGRAGKEGGRPDETAAGSTHAHIDAALRDLRHWHRMRLTCYGCTRNAYADVEALKRKLGPDTLFCTLGRRLVCKGCGARKVRIEVFNQPRD